MIRVSQSSIKLARKCWQAHHYKYEDKLKRRKRKRPFVFGTLVHDMIEAHINGNNPQEVLNEAEKIDGKLFESEREMYGDILEDVRLIMGSYFSYWPERDLQYIRLHKRSAEHKFEVRIDTDIVLTGKIDGIAESPTKMRWLVEHKSFTRLPNDDHRWRNLQSAVYIRVVDMLGWLKKRSLDGVVWDYIWSKAPTIPNILKDGKTLSRAKIDTLPTVVAEEVQRLKLNAGDNQEVMKMAMESETKYFHRFYEPVNPEVIGILFNEVVDTAREIAEYHGRKSTMNIDLHCDYCEYEPLCRARLLGNDVDLIMEREFYADTKAGEIEPAIDE